MNNLCICCEADSTDDSLMFHRRSLISRKYEVIWVVQHQHNLLDFFPPYFLPTLVLPLSIHPASSFNHIKLITGWRRSALKKKCKSGQPHAQTNTRQHDGRMSVPITPGESQSWLLAVEVCCVLEVQTCDLQGTIIYSTLWNYSKAIFVHPPEWMTFKDDLFAFFVFVKVPKGT